MLHKEQLRLELINQGSCEAKEQPPNEGASSQRISQDGKRGSQENLDNLNLEDERLGSEFDEDGIYRDNLHESGNTTTEEKPTWNTFISGGPDTPGIYPRILTVSEGNALKLRIKRLEDEILQREESCRVCGITFEDSVSEVYSCIFDVEIKEN